MTKVIKEKINFLKARKVKSPSRSYEFDAGIDFYVPEFDSSFIKDLKEKNTELFLEEKTLYSKLIATSSSEFVLTNSAGVNVKYKMTDINNTLIKFDESKGKNYFLLPPHNRVKIPSGIHVKMAKPGRALIAANKSGVSTMYGLIFGAQVVDYSYQGEVHISVINTSTQVIRIYEDMKIIQFLETPVFNSEIDIASDKDINKFYTVKTDRNTGGFGSTD